MSESTKADREVADKYIDQFYGSVSEEDLTSVLKTLQDSYIIRRFEGVAGLIGLSKIRKG